jgi:hypothetical protein
LAMGTIASPTASDESGEPGRHTIFLPLTLR